MSGTKIPAVWAALVALWDAAVPDDVQVAKGPVYDPSPNFLAVGWDRTDQPSIAATNERFDGSARRGLETFDISSLLSFSYDADSIDLVLAAIFDTYQTLAAAVATDVTLGRVALNAWISEYDVTPILTELGSVMDLRFTTHVETVK